MKIRSTVIAVMLLAVAFMVMGTAGPALAEKTLRVGIPKEPVNLNPVLISEIYGESVACSLFDTLVSFKESASKPAPLLAEKWEISPDGKIYTFHLRKGVKFHNGQDLTSADVVYTYKSIQDPANASPSKQFFEPVAKIEAPDDYTVRLTLNEPYAPMLLAIGTITAGVIPQKTVEEMGMEKFDRAPIGTGAFKFVEWVPDDRIVLEKNKDYFLGEPKIDKVVFRPIPKPEVMASELQAGGLDIGSDLLPQDIDRLGKEGLNVVSAPGLNNSYVGFSFVNPPFSDVRFRQAVYYSMPFDQAIAGIFRNTCQRAYSWIPVGVPGDDVEYMKTKALPFDEAKARELFDELKKEGLLKDGFEFSIYTPQNPQRRNLAEAISSQLRKYGMTVKVESPEWGTLLPLLKKGDAGMYIIGWGSVPDPDRWTYKLFHPESVWNFSHYNVQAVTDALVKGRTVSDPDERAKIYAGAMRKALGEDYIHIPLVWQKTINVLSKRVKDFKPSPQQYINLVTGERNVDLVD